MGRALGGQFPQARAVFEEVDAALSERLSAIMFEGPEETLTLTASAQPALMVVSMAIIRVMEARGGTFRPHPAMRGAPSFPQMPSG